MLEIDGVRGAIETHGDYERVDKLSDLYFKVVDLATRPAIGPDGVIQSHRYRRALDEEQAFIARQLERSEDLYSRLGHGSVTAAYASALEQIDQLVGYSNLAER